MRSTQLQIRQWIAGHTAKLMFTLSLVFLCCQAILVVLLVDVPQLAESALSEIDPDSVEATKLKASLLAAPGQLKLQSVAIGTMILLWPVFVCESILHWLTRPWDRPTRRFHFFGLLFCICPSLRMCARCPELDERIWLPGLGWRKSNRRLRSRLERLFSVPMIMIALLILPVLIVSFFLKSQIVQYSWLRIALHVSTGVIWFAFAAEFILMISVAEKKIDYCKKHWVDLAIIFIPFVSFLRSLRVLRASRAATLLQVSQISKIARVYRLRGTAVKAFRGLVLLDLFGRLAGGSERSIRRMESRLEELEIEAASLRRKIRRLRRMQLENEIEDDEGEAARTDEAVVPAEQTASDMLEEGHREKRHVDETNAEKMLAGKNVR